MTGPLSDQQSAADLADALAEAEWFLAARSRRVGLTDYAQAVVARVWVGPGPDEYADLTEAALRALTAYARQRLEERVEA